MAFSRYYPVVIAGFLASLIFTACEQRHDKAAAPADISAERATDIRRPALQTSTRKPHRSVPTAGARSHLTSTGFAGPMRDRSKQTIAFGAVTLPGGSPAQAAEVTLWSRAADDMSTMPWHRSQTVITDTKGRFRVMGVRDDEWALTAKLTGFATAWKKDERRLLGNGTGYVDWPVDIQLGKEAVVRGKLEGNQQLDDTLVFARRSKWSRVPAQVWLTRPDRDGHFELRGAPEGNIILCAVASGMNLSHNEINPTEFQVVPPLEPSLPLAGTLTSDVELTKTTATIALRSAGASPYFNFKTRAASDGKFAFPQVPAGEYCVVVNGDPVQLHTSRGERWDGVAYVAGSLTIKAGSTEPITIAATAGKIVKGLLVDMETMQPVAGARVYSDILKSSPGMHETVVGGVVTTATGEFVLTGIYEYSDVRIASDDYYYPGRLEDLFKAAGADTTITVPLRQAPFIRGRVESPAGTLPAGASVSVVSEHYRLESGQTVAVNPDGTFQARGKNEVIMLTAQAPGFNPVFSRKLFPGGKDLDDIVLKLGSGREVTGIVQNEAGESLAGILVEAYTTRPSAAELIRSDSQYSRPVYGPLIGSITTKADGRFSFNDMAKETGLLLITKETSAYNFQQFYVGSGKESLQDIKLILSSMTPLTIFVTDADDRPVTGAQVQLKSLVVGIEKETDTSGVVTTKALPRFTTHTLTITKSGFQTYKVPFFVNEPEMRVILQRPEVISIKVRHVDAETNEPVDADFNFSYTSRRISLNTNQDRPGEFRLTELNPGEKYMLLSWLEGYAWTRSELFPKIVGDGNEFIILMKKTATWTGRVVDGRTGQPVAGAQIFQSRRDRETTHTDELGQFQIEGNSGETSYFAQKGSDRRSAEFTGLATTKGDFNLGDIKLEPPVNLVVQVKTSAGKPVVGTAIQIAGYSNGPFPPPGITDENGQFKTMLFRVERAHINLLEYDQSQRLSQASPGATEQFVSFEVGNGQIQGVVTLNGKPIGASISAIQQSNAAEQYTGSDSQGKYQFTKLGAGQWKISAGAYVDSAYVKRTVAVDISNNASPVRLDIDLTDSSTDEDDAVVRFRVETESGDPVPVAMIYLHNVETKTDDDIKTNSLGEASTFLTDIGNNTAFAEKPGEGRSKVYSLAEMPEGNKPIRLVLTGGDASVACTVLSEVDGFPIQGATGKLIDMDMNVVAVAIPGAVAGDLLFDNLPAGDYLARISAKGFGEAVEAVSLEAGDRAKLSVVLGQAAEVNITVVDNDGRRIPGSLVMIKSADSGASMEQWTATANEQGIATFDHVPSGDYTGTVSTSAAGGAGRNFNFSAANKDTVDFSVPAGL